VLPKGEELKTNAKFILFVFIACAVIFTPQPVRSQNAPNMDVVLVIDSSGSMQKTDPLSLRVPAAKLFISLLEKGDRAGIVSFSDRGYVLSGLVPVDSQEHKETLFSAADRISADGLYTNLFEGFNSGYEALALQKESGREKIMVLMSDGMMDVGNLDQDRRLIDTLENSLTETLRNENIRVYTIAFTDQSDRKLLEKISKRTGGFYNTALTDKDFHGVFTSIFESLKSPEMVPMSENSFFIDSSIEELTIVATKNDPDTDIQIISPNGESYSSSHKYSGIGWFVAETFDMITILRPLEGKWEILFSTGENNKAYVITNLKLQSNFDQMYAIFGEHMDIRIWLERDGATITEEEVLDKISVYVELTGPDGNTAKLEAFHKGDGIFQRTFAPFTAGTHKMKLVAEGMTFERAKSFAFNVANLEDSKKDLQEQREEKKRQMDAGAGVDHEGEKDGGEVSFIKLFLEFIVMNIIIGIIVLGYFKREKVRNFITRINIKGLVHNLKGLTKFIKRKRSGNEESEEQVTSDETDQSAEESPSAQTVEEVEATGKGNSAEEKPPQAAPETGEQPEAEAAPEASSEKAFPEQEAEEIQSIEAEPEPAEDKNGEDPQKSMIDLEEIEMEEKGKYEEALQEDREQMSESLPNTEDDLLEAVSHAVDMLEETTEQPAEAETDESDDIELSPKESLDQPEETPQHAAPEETTAQPVETEPDESDDIELSPKEGLDQPEETPQHAVPEESTELPVESEPDESDDIELSPKESLDQPEETSQHAVPEESTELPVEANDEVDARNNGIAEMEEAMDRMEQPGEEADAVTPGNTLTEDAEGGTKEDISSA